MAWHSFQQEMDLMIPMMQVAATIVIADVVSGAIHWAEDAYARKDTPIIGKLIGEANLEHHVKPRAFVARSWWESSWDLALIGALIIAAAWGLDLLTWQVWLFVIVAVNANQIHKWAHQNPRENGRIITWLQKARVLQSPRHHAKHHLGQKNTHYCAVTGLVNPVLDRLKVWTSLEKMIEAVFGVRRRVDPTVKT